MSGNISRLINLRRILRDYHKSMSVGFCRGSRVEGNMSRVEVEGKKKCFFVWSISTRSRFSHILGFHLTSGKTKIKNSEFSSSSGRSQF